MTCLARLDNCSDPTLTIWQSGCKLITQEIGFDFRGVIDFFYFFYFSDLVKQNDNDIEFQKIFQRLCDEDIQNLPTGGELYSK